MVPPPLERCVGSGQLPPTDWEPRTGRKTCSGLSLFWTTSAVDRGGRTFYSEQVSSDYVITRRGVEYVLYTGLLVAAHQLGVVSISAQLLQLPAGDNGWVAVCSALVATQTGSFTALGDAHPGNAARSDVSTLILLAQLRAKAHALCDALNLGMTPMEDLPGYVPE